MKGTKPDFHLAKNAEEARVVKFMIKFKGII